MLHRLRRRPKPATALAATALFVALGGTAVAQTDLIITSPDQLGTNVVTGTKIAPNSITTTDVVNEALSDLDLRDPQLKVRALGNGSLLSGSDGTVTRTGTGSYQVTFSDNSFTSGPGTQDDTMLTENCAFSAVARNKMAIMEVDGPFASSPNSVRVQAAFPGTNGLLSAVDTQFDVLASC